MNTVIRLAVAATIMGATCLAARADRSRLAQAALLLWCGGWVAAFTDGISRSASAMLWLFFGWAACLAYVGIALSVGQTLRRLAAGLRARLPVRLRLR